MKTEYREHPLGTPGLHVRLVDETAERRPASPFVRRVTQALVRLFRPRGR